MSGRRTNSTRPAARVGAGLAAAALVSLALPVTTGTAAPATPSAASAATGSLVRAADPEFAGYAATTTATPVRVEIFEPTIPIPASPQAELNLGYSIVKADSSTSRGRASYFWPGDAVGEGFKTIVENLGLPPELAGPIAEQGYPVQVNSNHPAGPESESSEDFPGSISRTSASAEKTMALAGYSTDCRLGQPDAAPAEEGEGGEGGEDEGPIPGLPGLPDLPFPGIPGLGEALSSTVDQTVTTLTGGALSTTGQKGQKGGAKAAEEEVECPIPAQLAAVIDLGGVGASSTVTRSTDDDGIERVKAVSRSVVGEVSLLGGIITLDGLVSTARTTSDGAKATVKGVTDYGTLTIAGQKFRYGSDPAGPARPAGRPQPGARGARDPAAAAPADRGARGRQGHRRRRRPPGRHRRRRPAYPAGQRRAPDRCDRRGHRRAAVPGGGRPAQEPAGRRAEPLTEVRHHDRQRQCGRRHEPGDRDPRLRAGRDRQRPDQPRRHRVRCRRHRRRPRRWRPAGLRPGLPELFSIPGALFFGGILGATVLGSYLRRLGLLALGGGVSCAHGLESGLPDLRKA